VKLALLLNFLVLKILLLFPKIIVLKSPYLQYCIICIYISGFPKDDLHRVLSVISVMCLTSMRPRTAPYRQCLRVPHPLNTMVTEMRFDLTVKYVKVSENMCVSLIQLGLCG